MVSTRRKRTRTDEEDDIEHPAKREATSESSTVPPEYVEYHKDEEFWFEDGTIILVARDVEFRVYGGLLADHSPVLKDLFAQAHPTRTLAVHGEHAVPLPVIHLSDSPEDLRHVLRVYMPRKESSYFGASNPAFHMISASIRLGHKYQMTELYTQALQHLKIHYTTNLDSWKRLKDWTPAGFAANHAIGVVNLARLTGELSILPTAFLVCIFTVGSALVHGFTREDGTQETLSPDDLALCFATKTRLTSARIAALLRILHPVKSDACVSHPSYCKEKLQHALQGLKDHSETMASRSPFVPYTCYVQEGTLELCPKCTEMVQGREKQEQREIWGRLPEYLGIEIPGWPPVPPVPPVPPLPPVPPPPAVRRITLDVSGRGRIYPRKG